ncbi:hypothetical protein L1987_78175 [Smallanthus sonchifolius]|uniref:Uncharacterized protein n=1 Tax=Smallanthus sonchifolius TaxID=185202 RepID=A0ACB8ZD01_9ASTR|nr:hypothetical protein L1987_78175 [Smallanthus sonchifolius]
MWLACQRQERNERWGRSTGMMAVVVDSDDSRGEFRAYREGEQMIVGIPVSSDLTLAASYGGGDLLISVVGDEDVIVGFHRRRGDDMVCVEEGECISLNPSNSSFHFVSLFSIRALVVENRVSISNPFLTMGFPSSLGLLNQPLNLHSPRPRVSRILCCAKDANHFSNPHKPLRVSYSKIDERTSSTEVKKEIEMCYELIRRLGRGVVYLGSSRMGPGHEHYIQTQELAREVANLLGCTSWSGAGPGLMDAATQGALQAGKPVGGFKIGKEANEWTSTNFHPYLPSHTYLTCRFFSARKHGLVDAAVRTRNRDKTGVIVLPGGIGTLDEAFEILALIQLERIGSALPVPFILMNYDSFYSKLLEFLDVCEDWGTLSKGEVSSLWKVCNNNSEALAYLSQFYNQNLVNKP